MLLVDDRGRCPFRLLNTFTNGQALNHAVPATIRA